MVSGGRECRVGFRGIRDLEVRLFLHYGWGFKKEEDHDEHH